MAQCTDVGNKNYCNNHPETCNCDIHNPVYVKTKEPTTIKQHTLQSEERILLAEVPSDYEYRVIDDENVMIGIFKDADFATKKHYDLLPNGNWQLIGISDEMTEEQAKTLVFGIEDGEHSRYQCYTNHFRTYASALESFQSLLQSLGCEGRCAVLKEV